LSKRAALKKELLRHLRSKRSMLAKVAAKNTRTVINALIKQTKKPPKELYKPLGPGQGTDGSSALYDGDQHRCLFLRPAKPVAARVERE
jgi:hypothetical protein